MLRYISDVNRSVEYLILILFNFQKQLPKGISPGDCYRLYAQHKVQASNGDRIQMLRLKSTTNQEPLGPCISYVPLDQQDKQKILALREDEQDFFISVPNFLRTFTHIGKVF